MLEADTTVATKQRGAICALAEGRDVPRGCDAKVQIFRMQGKFGVSNLDSFLAGDRPVGDDCLR